MKSATTLTALMIFLAPHSLSAQTKIGLTGGVSFANVSAKYKDLSISPKQKRALPEDYLWIFLLIQILVFSLL